MRCCCVFLYPIIFLISTLCAFADGGSARVEFYCESRLSTQELIDSATGTFNLVASRNPSNSDLKKLFIGGKTITGTKGLLKFNLSLSAAQGRPLYESRNNLNRVCLARLFTSSNNLNESTSSWQGVSMHNLLCNTLQPDGSALELTADHESSSDICAIKVYLPS